MSILAMNDSDLVAQAHSNSLDEFKKQTYEVNEVHKKRKQALIGGTRVWSKEEEVYLLQTRLQKIPYRHIASHLKKTELACRLHYHHLSHGSRRKKASSSSPPCIPSSPIITKHNLPSVKQSGGLSLQDQSFSPQHFTPLPQSVQLPSASTLISRSDFLPPPRNYDHVLPRSYQNTSVITNVEVNEHSHYDMDMHSSSHMDISHVDSERLSQIYEKHRASFWNKIAMEYGMGAPASLLEKAWNRESPIDFLPTPCVSPNGSPYYSGANQSDNNYQEQGLPGIVTGNRGSVSISDLLGIDASPCSPEERKRIRQMEERRGIAIAS